MAILTVLTDPHPLLRRKSKSVQKITPEIQDLLRNMRETMYAYAGIGLAAPQIGVLKRAIMIDITGELGSGEDLAMINPEIIWASDHDRSYQEGCLSVPGHYIDIERPAEVKVRYTNLEGHSKDLFCDGLLATCVQHEIDHLDGLLILDQTEAAKKHAALRAKLKRAQKTEDRSADCLDPLSPPSH